MANWQSPCLWLNRGERRQERQTGPTALENTETRGRDKRVLLVDDDPVVLDILGTGLSRAGYAVDTCAEAEAALSWYRDTTPDIAVVDVGLPDMSGTDLARELLRAEYRPVLILSNYKDQEIVRRAITSGVVGYLVKPLTVEQLIPSLETSLSRHDARGERVAAHLCGERVSNRHLTDLIDRFPFALLIVDEHHHPIYRNTEARRLLNERVLRLDPAGRLRSGAERDDLVPVLDRALAKAGPGELRAVKLNGDEQQRLHAWAAPLGGETGDDGDGLAAVAVFDGDHARHYPWHVTQALYGLTHKETQLINGLLQGQTLDDYCEANFVTGNTARTHLKSIYRKTSTNRQSEVVRLFATMFIPDTPDTP